LCRQLAQLPQPTLCAVMKGGEKMMHMHKLSVANCHLLLFLASLLVLSMICMTSAVGGWRLGKESVAHWRPMPDWLANPSANAKVEATDEGLRFSVPEAGKGMKWLINARWVNTTRFRYFVVRYKAVGLDTNRRDYFVWVNDNSRRSQEEQTLIWLNELKSDGQWHYAVADLKVLEIRPYLSHLAIQVQASQPNCEVFVKELAFCDRLPEGVVLPEKPLPPFRERLLPLQTLARLRPQPTWLPNPADSAEVRLTESGLLLRVRGFGRGMKWALEFDLPLQVSDTPYLLVEYRAVGVLPMRDYFVYTAPRKPVLPQPNYHAAWLDELVADGNWHRLMVRVPEPAQRELATIAIQVQSESEVAEVVIRSIKFANRPPEPDKWLEDVLPEAPRRKGKFVPLDISDRCNIALSQLGLDLPVRDWKFRQRNVVAAGIPFIVSTKDLNAVSVETDEGMGTIAVHLDKWEGEAPAEPKSTTKASEAYLLMAASFPRWEEPSYGGGPLIRIRHPHRFVVEIVYRDGSSELYFPLRVSSRRPEIVWGLDVYVVPLRKPAKEIRLHDRMRLGDFGLCGLTLNLGEPQFGANGTRGAGRGTGGLWDVPSLPIARQSKLVPPKRVSVQHRKDRLILENANLRLVVQLQPPMLAELWLLPAKRNVLTAPVPLFSVQSWDGKVQATSDKYQLERGEGRGARDEVELRLKPNVANRQSQVAIHLKAPNPSLPDVQIVLRMDEGATVEMRAVLHNRSQQTQRWHFHLPARWGFRIGENDFYAYPVRTAVISDREISLRFRYSGWLPLQFLDLSAPELGIGLGLMTKDLAGFDRHVELKREGKFTHFGISWHCDPINSGESVELPPIELFVHSGDWRQSFERYKAWVRTWYQPLAPRKEWFRKVFAFRQDYIGTGLFDFATKTYRFAERVQFAREAFGACDYLHIFDWGITSGGGRVGDYKPWDEWLTTAEEFKEAVAKLQSADVPVGLYIEGYLVDERSRVGKLHGQEWAIRNPEGGIVYWEPGSPEFFMCPGAKGWQDYLAGVYRRVREETGALGFYIDQFGSCDLTCFASTHDHPPDWHVLPGEGQLTRKVRQALPPECVVYTENFPPDIHTVLQDGSFDCAINYFQTTAHRWMPVPVRLGRFVFPDFKVLQIIVCDLPVGTNEEAVRQVFFNGDGFWIQDEPDFWWQPEALSVLRKCIAILREHADAFASDRCEPLVPTLVGGVFANKFEGKGKTVWTLYNANWRSVSDEILAVPHVSGARYIDAWNGVELKPRIVGKTAYLRLTLEPHGVGCVVQVR
jgi:hypothetical protein